MASATITFHVPKRSHYQIIGPRGTTVKRIQDEYNCHVAIPASNEAGTAVVVSGAADVEGVRRALSTAVGFEVGTEPIKRIVLEVPLEEHGRIIGKRGAKIQSLERSFRCNVYVPQRSENRNEVEIEGPEQLANKCRESICEILGYTPVTSEQAAAEVASIDLSKHINEVLFFPDESADGNYAFQRFFSYLSSAKKSMDICVFTITDDRITNLLIRQHAAGVRVRILTDNDTAEAKGSDIETLVQSGIPVKKDISPHHMHNKFCIIDGRLLLNGSYNWTRTASLENCENILITNKRQLVEPFLSQFDGMWTSHLFTDA